MPFEGLPLYTIIKGKWSKIECRIDGPSNLRLHWRRLSSHILSICFKLTQSFILESVYSWGGSLLLSSSIVFSFWVVYDSNHRLCILSSRWSVFYSLLRKSVTIHRSGLARQYFLIFWLFLLFSLQNEDIIQGIASILFCLPTELKDIVMDSLKVDEISSCYMKYLLLRSFASCWVMWYCFRWPLTRKGKTA